MNVSTLAISVQFPNGHENLSLKSLCFWNHRLGQWLLGTGDKKACIDSWQTMFTIDCAGIYRCSEICWCVCVCVGLWRGVHYISTARWWNICTKVESVDELSLVCRGYYDHVSGRWIDENLRTHVCLVRSQSLARLCWTLVNYNYKHTATCWFLSAVVCSLLWLHVHRYIDFDTGECYEIFVLRKMSDPQPG